MLDVFGFFLVMPGLEARGHAAFAVMGGSVLGAALQLQQSALWHWSFYAALVAAAAVGWRVLRGARQTSRRWLCAALLVGAAAGGGAAGWRAAAYAGAALDPTLEGRDLQLVGVVATMPQRGERSVRFRFEVESASWPSTGRQAADADVPKVPPMVALSWYGQDGGALDVPAPVHAGERWRMTVRLKAPHGNLNPHGFDQELRLWELGVHATGYVRSGAGDEPPRRVGATWRHPVERARESVRDAVLARVADRKSAGVVAALVTGDQNAIDAEDWDIYRATGVAHLMSISGLHITMFAWLAAALVGALWRLSGRLMLRWPAPHAALVGGIVLAALYALFSGWGVPSQRTVYMLATVGLLRLTGRRWPWPCVWLGTCAVVVALDPWALMQPGFWLSFVAVGVLFAAGSTPGESTGSGAASRLLRMWREQWVVTLALTPLVLLLFNQVSLIGLVANAIAIPWVTLLITPLAMLGVAVAPLWDAAAWAVRLLAIVLQWLAALPYATLSMPAPALWASVAGVAGGVLLAMRLPWAMRLLGLPLLLPVLLWQAPRPASGEFELLAADIGQGNAVLVRTARHSLLYDTGPSYGAHSDAGDRVLVPLLRALGERLDVVMLSHRDSDHTGGAAAVLMTQPQAVLRSSIEGTHPLQSLRASQRCLAGQHWNWDGVEFEVLHPVEADYASASKPNAISCVLRIGNGRATALLAGDIERLQEAALVARTPTLRADLLLVPHHGSKTSSSPDLLDAVRPRFALVQSGYRNRFGHPAHEVVERYIERGTRVFDSARCGAVLWSSADGGDPRCHRNDARRYWHHVLEQQQQTAAGK